MKDQTRPHADREGLNPLYATAVFQGVAPADGWPAAFVIITACDPDGKKTDPTVNQSADFQLESELRIKGCRYWRVTGGSPDFAHAESGYAAELPLSEALELGRKYRQEAIFWIERDELIIVGCGSELRQELGSWSERLALGNRLLSADSSKSPGTSNRV